MTALVTLKSIDKKGPFDATTVVPLTVTTSEPAEDGWTICIINMQEDEVFGPDGNSLLVEGSTLSERHRSLLGKRGVEMVNIVTAESEAEAVPEPVPAFLPEEGDDESSKAREEIATVFAACDDDETMKRLMRLALDRAERIRI